MSAPSPVGPARIAALLVFACAGLAVRPSAAQSPEGSDPTGGLRSRGMVPGIRGPNSSREELVRQWDLDGNGTIDASEASIARARMRRSRMQLELDSGIDPVTGKPRVIAAGEPPADEAAPADGDLPADMPPEPVRRAAGTPALPGTRVPDIKAPDIKAPDGRSPDVKPNESGSSGPSAPTVPKPADSPSAAEKPSAKGLRPAASASRPGSIIGGTRAGAPAARPGYGSIGPKPDLNAGIPRPDPGRPATARGEPPRGGLLPSMRPPAAARPNTPAAPSPRPPRVSADEIGGF